jgi:tRNA G18 (ribose-2'-O)-methylase SpoU
MAFSKQKFLSLPQERQIKKIFDLITEIEKNWQQKNERMDSISHLRNYAEWVEDNRFKKVKEILSNIEKRAFYQLIVPLQKSFQIQLKDSDFIIFHEDKKSQNSFQKIPVAVCLVDLRSAFNVGSIFRSSECFQLEKIILCGYTPTPDEKKTQITAMGTENYAPWEHIPNVRDVIGYYKQKNYAIFALETTSNAASISEIPVNRPILLLLGNEALGLSKDILRQCDSIYKIPLFGWKNSLNVGVAFAITAYELRKKFDLPDSG